MACRTGNKDTPVATVMSCHGDYVISGVMVRLLTVATPRKKWGRDFAHNGVWRRSTCQPEARRGVLVWQLTAGSTLGFGEGVNKIP